MMIKRWCNVETNVLSSRWFTDLLMEYFVIELNAQLWHRRGLLTAQLGQLSLEGYRGILLSSSGWEFVPVPNGSDSKGLPHGSRWRAYSLQFIPMVWSCPCICFLQPNEVPMLPLALARPAVPLGLWSITSSLCGNFYVPRLHKFIKRFADNDFPHRNLTCTELFVIS